MKYLLIALFVIFLFIIGPCATIWALNTLFPALAIPLTFETWVAVVVLWAPLGGTGIFGSSKK